MDAENQPPIQNLNTSAPEQISKSHNWYKVATYALLGIIIIVGVVFSGMHINKKSTQPVTINPESSIQTDPTANWQTYSGNLYSFKYPNDWDTLSIGGPPADTLMIAPKEKVAEIANLNGGFGGGSFLTMTINVNTQPGELKSDEFWQVTSEPVTIGNITATKYSVNVIQDMQGFSKGDTITSITAKIGNQYVSIEILDSKYKDTFDQIVSTFRFTDKTTGLTPVNFQNNAAQSPYEKCIYQCIEGKGESANSCKPQLQDLIDNYDKYYSPYGVSSAFADKYADRSNPQSQETATNTLCFRLVVGCRVNLCKDYLNNQ